MEIKIEDNFLKQKDFDRLHSFMFTGKNHEFSSIPWYYNNYIVRPDDKDKFQFTHVFYYKDGYNPEPDPQNSLGDMSILDPILIKIGSVTLWRIKANLLTRTTNIITNAFHTDMSDVSEEKMKQWTTSIFYINTNNGYTKFEDGTKVESVANRMVTFPANMKHTGTSCTDKKTRIIINFNYFSKGESVDDNSRN